LIKKYSSIFHNLNSEPIIFVSSKDEEETGSAGEQPDSNTLYGYTTKGRLSSLPFSFAGILYC
jgi:hypothetical protein